jgi:hypothetical protein
MNSYFCDMLESSWGIRCHQPRGIGIYGDRKVAAQKGGAGEGGCFYNACELPSFGAGAKGLRVTL